MAVELPAVIPKVACTLSELQGILIQKYPFLSTEEGRRNRSEHLTDMVHCCEIFSGRGAIAKGFRERGLESTTFDIRENESHRIHDLSGIVIVAEKLVHTYPNLGVCVIEPTCGSWIWCQLGCSLRAVDLVGNGMQKNVICGNATAELLGRVLYPLVEWLYVHRVTEQPETSKLWLWPSVIPWLRESELGRHHDASLFLWAFGSTSQKPLRFKGDWAGIYIVRNIYREVSEKVPSRKLHLEQLAPKGEKWATGTPSMGQSSQYPMWLGRAFAFAFEILQSPNDQSVKIHEFVAKMIASLPPPGTLSDEDQPDATISPHAADPGNAYLDSVVLPRGTINRKEVLAAHRARNTPATQEAQEAKPKVKVQKTIKTKASSSTKKIQRQKNHAHTKDSCPSASSSSSKSRPKNGTLHDWWNRK